MEYDVRRKDKLVLLPVQSIRPNPSQPRRSFDADEIANLSESIRKVGVLSPLIVRKVTDTGCVRIGNEAVTPEQYELIAGERRLRAAMRAGLKKVPCIIARSDDNGSALIALTENLQRRELNCFEQGFAMQRLMLMTESTQSELAESLGISQSQVANKVRLLRLSAEEREMILRLGISERQARALLRIESKGDRIFMIKRIAERNMSAVETEKAVDLFLKQQSEEIKRTGRRVIGMVDVRFFVNSIDNAVKMIRKAGINVDAKKTVGDEYIEINLTIPKNKVKC